MNPKEYRKALEDYHAMKAAEQKEIDDLRHWGVKGMKWGVRNYQNEDGSLTKEGREHYGVGDPRSAAETQKLKMKAERQKAKLVIQRNKAEAKLQMKMDKAATKNDVERIKAQQYGQVKEAEEETKQRDITAKEAKAEAKIASKESRDTLKTVVKGVAIAAIAAVAIKAIANRRVNSPEIKELASKGENKAKELDLLKDNYEAAQKRLVDLQKQADLAGTYKQAAQNNARQASILRTNLNDIVKQRNIFKTSAQNNARQASILRTNLNDIVKERDILKDNYGAAQRFLYGLKGAMESGKAVVGIRHSAIRVTRIPKEADHVTT